MFNRRFAVCPALVNAHELHRARRLVAETAATRLYDEDLRFKAVERRVERPVLDALQKVVRPMLDVALAIS